MLNHWIEELPEFGVTYIVISLLEEQKMAREQAEFYRNRVIEIGSEITQLAKKHWTDEEISNARKKFRRNRMKRRFE